MKKNQNQIQVCPKFNKIKLLFFFLVVIPHSPPICRPLPSITMFLSRLNPRLVLNNSNCLEAAQRQLRCRLAVLQHAVLPEVERACALRDEEPLNLRPVGARLGRMSAAVNANLKNNNGGAAARRPSHGPSFSWALWRCPKDFETGSPGPRCNPMGIFVPSSRRWPKSRSKHNCSCFPRFLRPLRPCFRPQQQHLDEIVQMSAGKNVCVGEACQKSVVNLPRAHTFFVVQELLRNAEQHSAREEKVDVSVDPSQPGWKAVLRVTNVGDQPFRPEKVCFGLPGNIGGLGTSLPLCRAICEFGGGNLNFASLPLSDGRFRTVATARFQ